MQISRSHSSCPERESFPRSFTSCQPCIQPARDRHPIHPVAWKLPLPGQHHRVATDKVNLPVRRAHLQCFPCPTGLYTAPSRQYNFKMFWPPRTMKIPLPGQNCSFPTSCPAWVVQAEEVLTLDHLSLPCPKETESKAKEELKNRRREEKGKGIWDDLLIETKT